MKKIISILLAFVLTSSLLLTCALAEEPATATDDLTEKVIANFMPLTRIPRETYNEAEVSNYLLKWAQDRGYEARQDKHNNIVFDVPATAGCENYPRVALQAHMDMVIAVDEGYQFNPKTDPIKVVRDETKLSAEHTTLGADDGIGIAIAQYLAENAPTHGPLRVIFTTDEEKTQTGVKGLDPAVVADVDYLINIDYETSDEIIVSAANAVTMKFEKAVTEVPAEGNIAFELSLLGSSGGHSGLDINKGRVNAIVSMCDFLYLLKKCGVDFRIASFEGGNAENAIPVSSKVVIVTDASNAETVSAAGKAFIENLNDTFLATNPKMHYVAGIQEDIPATVMSREDSDALICFCQNVTSGVYTMSQKEQGLVESSANLGLIKADSKKISIVSSVRSSENSLSWHLTNAMENLGTMFGFTVSSNEGSLPWPMKTDNTLAQKAGEIYEKQNGAKAKVQAVHAGLECGAFANMNPHLNMIAIGPDIKDAHTTRECVIIASVPKITNLISELLAELNA